MRNIGKLPAPALRKVGVRYQVELIVEQEVEGLWRATLYPGGGLGHGGIAGTPAAAVRAATAAWEKWERSR